MTTFTIHIIQISDISDSSNGAAFEKPRACKKDKASCASQRVTCLGGTGESEVHLGKLDFCTWETL